MRNLLLVFLIVFGFAGCTTVVSTPAIEPAPTTTKPVVLALLRDSDQAISSGQYQNASLALERALRIEPRNALLWHRLAKLRFQQQQYHQAIQLASKSNTLSTDTQMRVANWLLIADAHARSGQAEKARAARDRANQERN